MPVAGGGGGIASVFTLRMIGSEWGWGCDAKAFADKTFGLLRWAGLGHGDVPSRDVAAVQFAQSCCRQFGGGHGDKGLASRLACGWFEVQLDLGNGADPGKEEPKVSFSDAGREVADI